MAPTPVLRISSESLEFRVGIAVETVNGSGAKAFQLGIGEIGCFGVIQASMWLVL